MGSCNSGIDKAHDGYSLCTERYMRTENKPCELLYDTLPYCNTIALTAIDIDWDRSRSSIR